MKQLAVQERGDPEVVAATPSAGKQAPAATTATASSQETARRVPNEHDFRTIKLISNGAYGYALRRFSLHSVTKKLMTQRQIHIASAELNMIMISVYSLMYSNFVVAIIR